MNKFNKLFLVRLLSVLLTNSLVFSPVFEPLSRSIAHANGDEQNGRTATLTPDQIAAEVQAGGASELAVIGGFSEGEPPSEGQVREAGAALQAEGEERASRDGEAYLEAVRGLRELFTDGTHVHPYDLFYTTRFKVHRVDGPRGAGSVGLVRGAGRWIHENAPQWIQEAFLTPTLDWRNLTVEVKGSDSEAAVRINRNVHRLGVTPGRGRAVRLLAPQSEGARGFKILHEGRLLYEVDIAVRSVAFYDRYLILVPEGHFSSEHQTQQLLFIDLEEYRNNLGRVELGVYRMPVQVAEETFDLSVRNGQLNFGDVPIPSTVLEAFSQIQSGVRDMVLNLLSKETYDAVEPLVQEFPSFFESVIESRMSQELNDEASEGATRSVLNRFRSELNAQVQVRRLSRGRGAAWDQVTRFEGDPNQAEDVERAMETARLYDEHVLQSEEFGSSLQTLGGGLSGSRRLMARLKLMVGRVFLPRPTELPRLTEALAMLGASFRGHESEVRNRSALTEAALHIFHSKLGRISQGVAAAAIAGAYLTNGEASFIGGILEMGKEAMLGVSGVVSDTASLGMETFRQTVGSLSPAALHKNLIEGDRAEWLTKGTATVMGFIASVFVVPHLILNTTRLYRDLTDGRVGRIRERDGINAFRATARAFMEWGPQVTARYDRDLSTAAARELQSRESRTTDEQNAQGEEWVRNRLANETPSLYRRVVGKLNFFQGLKSLVRTRVEAQPDTFNESKIQRIAMTLSTAFLSMPAMTTTIKSFIGFWNNVFGSRSFIYYLAKDPMTFMTMVWYPRFIKLGLRGRVTSHWEEFPENEIHARRRFNIPTTLNGGRRNIVAAAWQGIQGATPQSVHWLANWLYQAVRGLSGPEIAEHLGSRAYGRDALRLLHEWEERIVPVEIQIQKVALKRSLSALFEYMKERRMSDEYQALFRTSGATEIYSQNFKKLNHEARVFLFATFEQLHEEGMRSYLEGLVESEAEHAADPSVTERLNLKELKERSLTRMADLRLSPADAEALVDRVLEAEDGALLKESARRAERAQGLVGLVRERLLTSRYAAMTRLDPRRNNQARRMQGSLRNADNPVAVRRAMVQSMVALAVDKPLEYAQTILLLAGVESGMQVLLHEEAFGNESFMHLSRLAIWTGFATNVTIDLLAGAWMKLQMDDGVDYSRVPEIKEYPRLSWLGYWWRNMTRDPQNSLAVNYNKSTSLIWHNVPAALSLYLVTHFLTLGRFDLGFYLSGYLLVVATPLSALAWKIENALENSFSYFYREVPTELRATPAVQRYVTARAFSARWKFNIFYKLYENTLSVLLSTFQTLAHPSGASRGMERIVFGGLTVADWVLMGTRSVRNWAHGIPFVGTAAESVMSACEVFFTKGINPAEISDRVPPPPEG